MSSEDSDMLVSAPPLGYSADVQIELIFNGRTFPVSQMGREMLILDQQFDAGSGEGEVVLTIDGVPRRWTVTIHADATLSRHLRVDLRDAV
jgi:hypothetical protein